MVPAAVLDACVLYPISLRDTLLNVAEAGSFRVLWTEEILTETARNIVRDTPGLTMEHLEKTFAAIRRAFPDAMISGYEPLIEAMTNHPKDRHVLAAAVAAQADVVVTANLRHFPPQSGNPHGIRIESPDQFLCDAMQRQPDVVAAALRAQAARKRHPPMSADEMLDRLAITVPNFARGGQAPRARVNDRAVPRSGSGAAQAQRSTAAAGRGRRCSCKGSCNEPLTPQQLRRP